MKGAAKAKKSTATSLAVWNLQMVDRIGKGLVVRGVMERNLIDQGDTAISLTTMSLGIVTMTQR